MRVKQAILAVLAILILSTAALTAFAETKIAVVDVARAVLNSEFGQAGIERIQTDFKKEEEALRAMQKEATTLLEKLKKDTELMSEQEFNQLLEEIQIKNSEFVGRGQALQRAIEDRQQRLIQARTSMVREAIDQLVLKDDYDIIIPKSVTLYSGELYDITLKLTEKLNELENK